MEINGQQVQNAFAVTVPGQIRSTGQQYLYERMAMAKLEWREWRFDGSSGPKLSGQAVELGNVVARTTPPAGNLDEAVDILDQGARRAGSPALSPSRYSRPRLQDIRSGPHRRVGKHGRARRHQCHGLPGATGRRRGSL